VEIERLTDKHVKAYEQQLNHLRSEWEKHLKPWSVIWPTSPVKLAQLVGLSFFVGLPVDKDSLGRFVSAVAGGALDTQARHLRGDGWYVVGGGRGPAYSNSLMNGVRMPRSAYALASLTAPIPSFVQSDRLKRQGRIGVRDWSDLCALYEGKCAHCGTPTRNPDKGHMDPDKGAILGNLIPLCVRCNNWAGDDVIFDENGRVSAISSERFLSNAPLAARRRMLAWLQRNSD
jgi:hypothetical protein